MDDRIIEQLNDRQREAVFETEGYVRVIAGAGSGKTKLLVSRYAYLVQEYGIDTANILCVTFTNKAAGEMKKRIRRLIGEEYDTGLICTYHGFCNRLLRDDPEKLFLNKQFQIIDSYQQKTILSEIYQKYELKLDYASFEVTLHRLGEFKAKSDYVPRMCNPEPCQIMDEIKDRDDQILEDFLQKQKATYALDFHDLIAFAIYVLENNEEIREKWQERLNYIMVDEFQDSSKRELKLIDILSGGYKNVMIVGDPDQNIYEWRGSDVKLLVDFDKEHVPTETIFLNQNYRSTPQILKCANTLIEKNELRLKKDLFTENPSGNTVIHYHSKNDFEEMDHIVENIKWLMKISGFKYSDFAILYRTGFLSRIAEKKLVETGIPYEIYGGVKFYQRMEILDVLAYLKLIAFDDDASFKRIINTPRRKFGRTKLARLVEIKEGTIMPETNRRPTLLDFMNQPAVFDGLDSPKSLFETLRQHINDREFADSDVAHFISMIDSLRQKAGTMSIADIVNDVTQVSGYEDYIRGLGDEERLDNLAEFKRIANEFEREFGEDLTLEEFLQQIALQSGEGNEKEQDTVKLMTIHAAKGLEFPVVFILGFTEGIFPSSKTIEERKALGLEEERRLCYVALTRAEKYLYLMDSEGVSPKGIKKLCSRFLDEIGQENYTTIGKISDELRTESRRYINRLNSEMRAAERQEHGENVGDTVEHHIFGRGTIVRVDEKRDSYIVKFASLDQQRSISRRYFEMQHFDLKSRFAAPQVKAIETKTEPSNPSNLMPLELIQDEYITETGLDDKEIPGTISETNYDNDTSSQIAIDDSIPENNNVQQEILAAKEKAKNSPNLWKREDVPHSGWNCAGVSDLGAPIGICEMCGYQIIRYAHHMTHPHYHDLTCGCICAGRMEGDVEGARQREAELKKRSARRVSFFKRKWKVSRKGNAYLKIENHVVVVYNLNMARVWKYSIDETFCQEEYQTKEIAMNAAFETLEAIRKQDNPI